MPPSRPHQSGHSQSHHATASSNPGSTTTTTSTSTSNAGNTTTAPVTNTPQHTNNRTVIQQSFTTNIKKHLKWIVPALGLAIGGLTFIGLQPAYQSVSLAREANSQTTEGNELAQWSALLAFKQDCEARAVRQPSAPLICCTLTLFVCAQDSSKELHPNCTAVMAMVTPPPPSLLAKYVRGSSRVVRRSLRAAREFSPRWHLWGGLPSGTGASGLLLLLASMVTLALIVALVLLVVERWQPKARHNRKEQVLGRMMMPDWDYFDQDGKLNTASLQNENVALCRAAANGDFESVERLLNASEEKLISSKAHGTPLMLSIACNDVDDPQRTAFRNVMDILLSHGSSPNKPGQDGIYPLMHACSRGLLDEVRLLLKYGARTSEIAWDASCNSVTALHLACRGTTGHADAHNERSVFQALLRWLRPARATAKPHWVEYEFFQIAQALIDHNADVNARDSKGCTPLHWIMASPDIGPSQLEIISLLLEYGTNPDQKDYAGYVPKTFKLRSAYDLAKVENVLTLAAREELKMWKDEGAFPHGVSRKRKWPLKVD